MKHFIYLIIFTLISCGKNEMPKQNSSSHPPVSTPENQNSQSELPNPGIELPVKIEYKKMKPSGKNKFLAIEKSKLYVIKGIEPTPYIVLPEITFKNYRVTKNEQDQVELSFETHVVPTNEEEVSRLSNRMVELYGEEIILAKYELGLKNIKSSSSILPHFTKQKVIIKLNKTNIFENIKKSIFPNLNFKYDLNVQIPHTVAHVTIQSSALRDELKSQRSIEKEEAIESIKVFLTGHTQEDNFSEDFLDKIFHRFYKKNKTNRRWTLRNRNDLPSRLVFSFSNSTNVTLKKEFGFDFPLMFKKESQALDYQVNYWKNLEKIKFPKLSKDWIVAFLQMPSLKAQVFTQGRLKETTSPLQYCSEEPRWKGTNMNYRDKYCKATIAVLRTNPLYLPCYNRLKLLCGNRSDNNYLLKTLTWPHWKVSLETITSSVQRENFLRETMSLMRKDKLSCPIKVLPPNTIDGHLLIYKDDIQKKCGDGNIFTGISYQAKDQYPFQVGVQEYWPSGALKTASKRKIHYPAIQTYIKFLTSNLELLTPKSWSLNDFDLKN